MVGTIKSHVILRVREKRKEKKRKETGEEVKLL